MVWWYGTHQRKIMIKMLPIPMLPPLRTGHLHHLQHIQHIRNLQSHPSFYCRRFLSTGTSNASPMRLNKYLAHQGYCSRREADKWIKKGWVRVNGVVAPESGGLVRLGHDDVQVDATTQAQLEPNPQTILLHKPMGIVSAQPEPGKTPAVQLLTRENQFIPPHHQEHQQQLHYNPYRQRGWRVCGRLDINSTGLLVLTQSGLIAQRLVCPPPGKPLLEKEYLLRVPILRDRKLVEHSLHKMRRGVQHGDDFLTVKSVEVLHDDQWRIILTGGKKHHIRRLMDAINVPLRALKRVRIGNVVLGDLPVGQWRYLHPEERFWQ